MRKGSQEAVQQPHSPTLGEINTKHLFEAMNSNYDVNQSITDAYVENSNALISFLLDAGPKEVLPDEVYNAALSAMYQQHLLLYLNLTENDSDDVTE
ncbi:MAG TPA: hypothetical protein PLS10_08560 [Chitinophagales bacterium]|nr:hypothetical protein [Chitinophagales bacterium]